MSFSIIAQSSVTPDAQVIVKSASALSGVLLSDVIYLIDGEIDLGSASISVPEGGLNISGLGFGVSRLVTTGTLFTYSGSYAGDLQIAGMDLVANSVFDLDNAGNGGGVECNSTNFSNCASLGELANYRQGLWSNVGVIFCGGGLTMSGAWAGGFASLTSIVIGSFTDPLFKAGVGLTIAGSFRSDMNALGLGVSGVFSDFAPANILADGGFSMGGVRVTEGSNSFPNMPASSVKARFSNCVGAKNTYVGGALSFTANGLTAITAADTLFEITATSVATDMAWCEKSGNGVKYISSQSIEVAIDGTLSFSGGNNDQLGVQVRVFKDATSSYVDVGPEYVSTLNGGVLGTRAENVSFSAYADLEENDIVEVWIKNLTDTSDITTLASGRFGIKER